MSVGSNLTLGYEMKLRAPPDDDAPIEEWLAWLRDRSDDVERRLARRIDQSSGVQADQSQQLDVIRTALDKQEALTSGSIRLQWPGVMMFGIGAILSTASNLV